MTRNVSFALLVVFGALALNATAAQAGNPKVKSGVTNVNTITLQQTKPTHVIIADPVPGSGLPGKIYYPTNGTQTGKGSIDPGYFGGTNSKPPFTVSFGGNPPRTQPPFTVTFGGNPPRAPESGCHKHCDDHKFCDWLRFVNMTYGDRCWDYCGNDDFCGDFCW
jgi:hypothetical protein